MLNWKAVVLGAIADFAGSILAFHVLLLLWAYILNPGSAADDAAFKAVEHSPLFLAVSFTVGWYFDYLGGRVAGLIAKRRGLQHGLSAAVPGVILAVVDVSSPSELSFPAWFVVVSCAISLACACYGGARAVQGRETEAN